MGGGGGALDDAVGALLMGRPAMPAAPVFQDSNNDQFNGQIVESQLPPFPANFTPTDGAWQTVNGTR